MKVALGQISVASDWRTNQSVCLDLIDKAKENNADLLVLPEGIIARDINDPHIISKTAQPLDGPFMNGLCNASNGISIIGCITVPDGNGKFFNTQFVLKDGKIIDYYRKIHLYDAFDMQESKIITPGNKLPPVIDICGMKLGLMTCYDIRFPEMACYLALSGAEVFILPAAWVKGPAKERQWEVMVTARALENTCYIVAVGECGARNIGSSMVVDPLGVPILMQGETPSLSFAFLDKARIEYARRVLPILENRRFAVPVLADKQ